MVVPDRACRSRYGESFFFIIYLILVHARARTRATLWRARTRVSTKGPGALHFADTRPFFKLGKKGGEYNPLFSGPLYQITPPPFHLFILRSRVPLVPSASTTGVREKKIRPRWMVAEIGAARTGIRNEDGKCAVTTFENCLICSLYGRCATIKRSAHKKGASDKFWKTRANVT